MKKIASIVAGSTLLLSILSGCVGYEPAPYYGGSAPYYGTPIVPAYAYGEVGGYYPHTRGVHIYSRANNNYWHHQSAVARGSVAHGGGAHAGGGGHSGGGHR